MINKNKATEFLSCPKCCSANKHHNGNGGSPLPRVTEGLSLKVTFSWNEKEKGKAGKELKESWKFHVTRKCKCPGATCKTAWKAQEAALRPGHHSPFCVWETEEEQWVWVIRACGNKRNSWIENFKVFLSKCALKKVRRKRELGRQQIELNWAAYGYLYKALSLTWS